MELGELNLTCLGALLLISILAWMRVKIYQGFAEIIRSLRLFL